MKRKIKIDIVSDLVCPWCYIGSNRLIKALAESEIEADIRWVPFQLHPNIGDEGKDVNAFLEKKYNTPGEEMMESVQNTAINDNLPFNAKSIANMPNTLNGHRIMHLAREEGLDSKMSQLFFDSYFVKGEDLNSIEVLLSIAQDGGLDKEDVRHYLASDIGVKEIAEEEEHYKMTEGVWVVPAFIFNDDEMIEGAQTVENFKKFFKDINITLQTAAGCNDESCEID